MVNLLVSAFGTLSLAITLVQFWFVADENVTSHLELDGSFPWVLQFCPPFTN